MNQYEEIESRALNAKTLDDSTEVLAFLLSRGFSVWTDGELYNIKQLVARVDGIRIEVFAREHPPPHFHIEGGDIDATFSILDCSLIDGRIDRRQRALVEWWYKRSRAVLINAWNKSRPSDCPVGPIEE
jgi:hypothetical protein